MSHGLFLYFSRYHKVEIIAALKFFLRGKKIHFRYRPNRNMDVALATPYPIISEKWDENNQCWNLKEFVKEQKMPKVKN